MKNTIMLLITLFFLITPNLAGAQGMATPEDCGTVELQFCDQVYFGTVNDRGESVLLRVQRMAGDFDPAEVTSRQFALAYIEELNEDGPVFDIVGDGTAAWMDHVGPYWAPTWESIRVVQGTSDYLTPNQDAFICFVEANGKAYVFLIFGVHDTITVYLDDVLSTDNVAIIPEDFVQIKTDGSDDSGGGIFDDAGDPVRI